MWATAASHGAGSSTSSAPCCVNVRGLKLFGRAFNAAVCATTILLFHNVVGSTAAVLDFKTDLDGTEATASLWDVINEDPSYSKLVSCLTMADPSIASALAGSGEDPLTLFAPKDAAFDEQDWSRAPTMPRNLAELANDTIFNSRCGAL